MCKDEFYREAVPQLCLHAGDWTSEEEMNNAESTSCECSPETQVRSD